MFVFSFFRKKITTKKLLISVVIGLLSILFYSCQSKNKEENRTISPAFYHWKTNFDLSDFEKKYTQKIGIQKLYIKFFDVDWNGKMAIPQAVLNVKDSLIKEEIIPTIFITNRTFSHLQEEQIEDLAQKIHSKIFLILKSFPPKKITEIQFDCDWTQTTQEKYFNFLHAFKNQLTSQELRLSATIRLHQIKFFERTGVPPVDRGMLMFYNTGKLREWETQNSILDLTTAREYLTNFDTYPLELDLALPLFYWGILFREGKMVRLINNLEEKNLVDISVFEKIKNQRFLVKKNTYLSGHYIYEGDKIRLENSSIDVLSQSIRELKPLMNTNDLSLAFYHIDSLVIKQFEEKNLIKLVEEFRK